MFAVMMKIDIRFARLSSLSRPASLDLGLFMKSSDMRQFTSLSKSKFEKSDAKCFRGIGTKGWMRGWQGALTGPFFLFGVVFFGFLLGFFLFQTILIFPNERTELWIVVLLAVQRIV